MVKLFVHEFDSPIALIRTAVVDGRVDVVALLESDGIDLTEWARSRFPGIAHETGGDLNRTVEQQIREYLNRSRTSFTLPYDLGGRSFAHAVLRHTAGIPYGETRTYGQVAAALGAGSASRAVGAALGRNPLPLIVPCHRVVAADGFGGFGGGRFDPNAGSALKRRLLMIEQAQTTFPFTDPEMTSCTEEDICKTREYRNWPIC